MKSQAVIKWAASVASRKLDHAFASNRKSISFKYCNCFADFGTDVIELAASAVSTEGSSSQLDRGLRIPLGRLL